MSRFQRDCLTDQKWVSIPPLAGLTYFILSLKLETEQCYVPTNFYS
jgi:hypothetical protein